jgi:hypothetical protein
VAKISTNTGRWYARFASDLRSPRLSLRSIGASTARALRVKVAMPVLKNRQRVLLADKVPDTANLAAGALPFGQFLSDRPFSIILAITGLAVWIAFFALAVKIAGEQGVQ